MSGDENGSVQDLHARQSGSWPGQPVIIGGCAGMFHPGPAAEGIIILPPFGHELLACAKTLRLLAIRLSGQGYPVLRLDFPGTGDALGDESTIDAVESRKAAAIQAALWMRGKGGVSDVSVAGVRFGGTIALLAAGEMGIHRLLLAAPILNGKAYIREMQQLQCFYETGPGSAQNAQPNEFMGFTVSEETLARMRGIDLRNAPLANGIQAALMAPAGLGAGEALVARWKSEGLEASLLEYDGVVDLISDPAIAPPEHKLIDLAAGWFGPAAEGPGAFWIPQTAAVLAGAGFSEQGCRFGETGEVYGVLCQPVRAAPGFPATGVPAVVLVTTGGNHHSGWARQSVELARALAQDGIASFRIDVHGAGETPDLPRRDHRVVYEENSCEDVLAAAAYLKTRGYGQPAIAGICSGAFLVFHALRRNAAISGALMINLEKFYWAEGDPIILYASMKSYASRLFEWARWQRVLRGQANLSGIAAMVAKRLWGLTKLRFSGLLPLSARSRSGNSVENDTRSPRDVISKACARGIHVGMAYTLEDGGIDEMRAHIGAAGRLVKGNGHFDFTLIDVVDHNFTMAASRARLHPFVRDFVRAATAKQTAQ